MLLISRRPRRRKFPEDGCVEMIEKLKTKSDSAARISSFLLPAALMILLFIIKGIYPFGDRSFLSGDLYHQYMPFFRELLYKAGNGESLDFSFHIGIGSNFLALFVYYLASPFHLPAFVLGERHLVEFLGYIVVFKTGLCGLTACVYFQRRSEKGRAAALFFALFYAFSGFMAAYNYNIMWLDCVWVFPLILLGLERLVREGRCGLYCAALAFSILTNFYISIMICIFLVLYFGMLFALERRGRLRSCALFAACSLLAGGMAAVFLIPVVSALLRTDFGNETFPTKIESYFSVLDMLARHLAFVYTERGLDHWPNLYCGSAALMFIPMYLMNRRLSIREKFCRLALAGFLLLSFSTNILNFIWHGFNYPDSLPARQSFCYIFLALTMCYDAYCHLEENAGQQILYGYLCGVGFILFCQKFIDHDDFEPGVELLSLLFLTIYAALLYLYRNREGKVVRREICILILAAVLTECGGNMWNTSIATTSRSDYLDPQEDYKALYRLVSEREDGFARVEKFTRKTKNDAALAGFPSASVFSSTLNSAVTDLYERLGMRHSKVYYGFDGATGLTGALLNVDYMFGESDAYECGLYTKLAESGGIRLYECRQTLPFGYVAPSGFDLPEGYKNQPLALQNRVVQELGVEGQLFSAAEESASGDDVRFTAQEGGIYYGLLTASGTSKITCIGGSGEEETFGDLKRGCVIYLGYLEKEQTITLTNGDEKDETPKIAVDIYRMDETVLAETLAALSGQHLEEVTAKSDAISGRITMEEAGRLILSVPWEDGWEVRINGEETKAELFGGCLMAFDLEPGTYEIEMQYRASGAVAGRLVTAVSAAAFALAVFLGRRRERAGIGLQASADDDKLR